METIISQWITIRKGIEGLVKKEDLGWENSKGKYCSIEGNLENWVDESKGQLIVY